jgi:hypothetical protein
MFFFVNPFRKRFRRVTGQHGDFSLQQDGACVGTRVHQMHRAAGFRFTRLQNGPVHPFAVHSVPAEFGQKRRVQIDDPAGITLYDLPRQNRKKTGQHNQIDAIRFRQAQDAVGKFPPPVAFGNIFIRFDNKRRNAREFRPLKSVNPRPVGNNQCNFSGASPVFFSASIRA